MVDTWRNLLKETDFVSYYSRINGLRLQSDIYPEQAMVTRSLDLCRPNAVRVLCVGLEPEHTEHSNGLLFGASKGPLTPNQLAISRLLSLHSDHMSFEGWAAQGVLMLPRLLTARRSFVGGHDGWLRYTSMIIHEVVQLSYNKKMCAILFGKENHVFKDILCPQGSRSQIKTFCVNYPKNFNERDRSNESDFDVFKRVNARFVAVAEPEIKWREVNV